MRFINPLTRQALLAGSAGTTLLLLITMNLVVALIAGLALAADCSDGAADKTPRPGISSGSPVNPIAHTGQESCVPDDGPTPICTPDLTHDGLIDIQDLLEAIIAWGRCTDGEICHADINGDGMVDVLDLIAIVEQWGLCQ